MAIIDVLNHIQENRPAPPPRTLLDDIADAMVERKEIPPPGDDRFFYMSGISDMCPREEVIAARHKITRIEEKPHYMKTAAMLGRGFEKWFRDEVLGGMGILYGKWKCEACGTVLLVEDKARYAKPKVPCSCGQFSWSFMEEKVKLEKYRISGKCDGVILYKGQYWLLELKTANNRWYNSFVKKGPPEYYYDQVQTYMFAWDFMRTLVILQNKDSGHRHLMEIERNDERIRYLMSKPTAYIEAMADPEGVALPAGLCLNAECPRARECQVRELCFAPVQ